MEILTQDKSSYLKGLLIIAKKDSVLAESEEIIIRQLAKRLGFSESFYEETLQSLLSNEYLSEDPLKFSDEKLSHSFIIDGLMLAYSDNDLDEREIDWLRQTAELNNINVKWFEDKDKEVQRNSIAGVKNEFALYSIID
ncbi:MAG: hypothetical protein DRQ13_03360 [Ignavibacteriae bacterium]|nr:MAG: hypothetical protein DRQ13_03360 [Ignavibacteriota bacterium]